MDNSWLILGGYNSNTNLPLNWLLSYSEHKADGIVPRSFPGVLQIFPGSDKEKTLCFHKDYREFGENGNEELEYFFKYLLAKIDPSRTKYRNKKNYAERSFDVAFTVSDEAFGLLVLDNDLEVWNQQFEAKRKDPNAKLVAKDYRRKYVKQHQKGTTGWTDEGILLYFKLKKRLTQLRRMKRQSTEKYLMKFRSEAGQLKAPPPTYFNNGKEDDEGKDKGDVETKAELEKMALSFLADDEDESVFFPSETVGVDGQGPMGI